MGGTGGPSSLSVRDSRASGRGSDHEAGSVGSRVGHAAQCAGVCVTSTSFRRRRIVLAEYLVSQQVGAARRRVSRDWARANDSISRKLVGEARETLAAGALEANTAIALAIGYRRFHPLALVLPSWAGINGRVPAFLHVGRKAEGAHHCQTSPENHPHVSFETPPSGC